MDAPQPVVSHTEASGPSGDAPTGLRCNWLPDPLAIRDEAPWFSWARTGAAGAGRQRSYQLLVARDAEKLRGGEADAWDSGRRGGMASGGVRYEGPPLERGVGYFWKVRIWTDGGPSAWSEVATFELGPGGTDPWTASWILWDKHVLGFEPATEAGPVDQISLGLGPVTHLRHEFDVARDLVSARLYITARGLYEARLNGARVGDQVLTPGWTDYGTRIPYQAYDVTGMLVPGPNAIGVLLGDGWYCGYFGSDPKRSGAHYGDRPELLAELRLRYGDGTDRSVTTDATWKANWGAILHADPLMGELRCSGLDPVGWDQPGFDARRWHQVASRARDDTAIVADPGPAVRVTETLLPVSLTPAENGATIIDFGQNLTGWIRLSVDGTGGEAVRLRHGEALDADGHLYVDNLRSARQTDELWTSGGPEVFEPHFTWHGFRYVEVTGYPGQLTPGDVSAHVVHSDVGVTGTFECGDPVTNRLVANIDWGLRGNFVSVPTDCPQRDERLGWLGDAQIFAPTSAYFRDVLAFFDKWLDDVMDAQMPSGAFADIAPRLGRQWCGAPGWGDAGVIVPWTLYKMYGALQPAARCYDAMSRWMAFLSLGNPDHLRTRDLGNDYGDWLAPDGDQTSHELLATAYWARDATLMGELASALDREADASDYRRLALDITEAFGQAFVDPDGRVESGTQTAYALALTMDLLPGHLRARAADHLVEAVRDREWHLSTGFIGVGCLLPALSGSGYSDVAYRLLGQETCPSWRYPIGQGATTIWERWDGWTQTHGFQSPHMNSFNHYSLGSVGEWLYRFAAGIEQRPHSVGFERVELRPHPDASISWARASFRSVRGEIVSSWVLRDSELTLDVGVPADVTATVHLPSADPAGVRDSFGDGPTSTGEFCGIRGMGEANFAVGPGTHRFVSEYRVPHGEGHPPERQGSGSGAVQPGRGHTEGS